MPEAPARAGAETAARSGLLILDKPPGITSHDLVARVRRALGGVRAGHLGTLDPGASGLLVVMTGAATRCAPVWQGGDKTYTGVARFGVVTATQDLGGEVLERHDRLPSPEEIRAAAARFVGEIEQVPPMVSAVKVGGERLYRLARRGVEVERAPRPVRVEEWTWESFDPPEAAFRVRCSGGTYVRTLVHDLGRALGSGAALAALRRLRSEPFGLERSVHGDEVLRLAPAELWERAGIGLEEALAGLPAAALDERGVEAIARGAPARWSPPAGPPADPPLSAGPRSVLLTDAAGRPLALGELVADPAAPERRLACPHVVFPWAVRSGPR